MKHVYICNCLQYLQWTFIIFQIIFFSHPENDVISALDQKSRNSDETENPILQKKARDIFSQMMVDYLTTTTENPDSETSDDNEQDDEHVKQGHKDEHVEQGLKDNEAEHGHVEDDGHGLVEEVKNDEDGRVEHLPVQGPENVHVDEEAEQGPADDDAIDLTCHEDEFKCTQIWENLV